MKTKRFLKIILFSILALGAITSGILAIKAATPAGNIKIPTGYQQYGSGRPVAWWKMDEASWNGTANEVVDSIGTNHGVAAGGATKANTVAGGVFGRAGSFDGVDDYVSVADSTGLDSMTTGLTISVWINPNSSMTSVLTGIVCKDNINDAYGLNLNSLGINGFVRTTNGLKYYTTTTKLPTGAWSYVTYIYDGTNLITYINGKYDSQLAWSGNIVHNSNSLWIGNSIHTPTRLFNGLVDDVRIYNYALTANQVKQIYNETAKIKMVNQQNATSTSNNPVGWWKFDETTAIHGSTLADSSGYGNTGTLSTGDGSTNKSVAGKLGKGLSFDGVNDYVDAGAGASLNMGTGDFSGEAWIKTSSIAVQQRVITKYKTTATISGFLFDINEGTGGILAGGNLRFKMIDTSSNALDYSYVGGITANNWYHIVFTVQRNSATGLKLYVNGVQIGASASTIAITGSINAAVSLFIGQLTGAWGDSFNGLIDDVRIYNRALSAGEVAQMYNSTKDGYLGNIKVSTGLVGYWKLDDNNALTSVIDYSGKGNTGTAYSGTATSTSVLSTSTAMIGRAMSFDGVDDWVGVADSASLRLSNVMTISVWIKPDTLAAGFKAIINKKYNAVTKSNYYFGRSGDKLYFEFTNDGLNYRNNTAITTAISAGVWNYVTVVYNDASDTTTFYKNGVAESLSQTYSMLPSTSGALSIGRNAITGGENFNGLIDEVKIWNYARSGEQVKQDYERGLRGLP